MRRTDLAGRTPERFLRLIAVWALWVLIPGGTFGVRLATSNAATVALIALSLIAWHMPDVRPTR